ncbi:MAG: putative sugar O-methyltransferase, partial [Candidatus Dormibacteraeota bacterium]|nr:putative sugar O-methyltransferase [Candidatus Dormibacteraeota bacterium]
VQGVDTHGLLQQLGEDGAFGCWTYQYPGHVPISRDLLESVNEICFLERQLGLSSMEKLSVLDIGAGYGRLAHRMSQAFPGLSDYCCVDAIAESTFLSRYYLSYRECVPPARVVRFDDLERELKPGDFDLAVNIHSFSECPLSAIAGWVEELRRLRVPRLLVIPNEPTEFLSMESDWSRRDFLPLLEAAGYRLTHSEPVIQDPAVRELLGLEDHFHLFTHGG